MSKNVPNIANFKSSSRPLQLQSELPVKGYLDLSDALNRMVPSISLYLYWFSSRKQKHFRFCKFSNTIHRPLELQSELLSRGYLDLFDVLNRMVLSISLYL